MTKKIKRLLAAAAICFVITASGCGDDGAEKSDAADISAAQMLDALGGKSYSETMDAKALYGEETFEESCEKLYGADAESFSDGGIMYASTGALADEISVIKAADGSTDCEQLLRGRIETRINDFEGYKPDELDKIKAAEVFNCGDLWILVISDDSAQIKQDALNAAHSD